MKYQPIWASLSCYKKYQYLDSVRHEFCSVFREKPDISNGTYILDGEFIKNIPCFYLILGEAINGFRGYYGACMDSLSDCFCGGFGAKPPFKIQIINSENVISCLDNRAWLQFALCRKFHLVDKNDLSLDELIETGILEPLWLFEKSYFHELLKLFQEYSVAVELLIKGQNPKALPLR